MAAVLLVAQGDAGDRDADHIVRFVHNARMTLRPSHEASLHPVDRIRLNCRFELDSVVAGRKGTEVCLDSRYGRYTAPGLPRSESADLHGSLLLFEPPASIDCFGRYRP